MTDPQDIPVEEQDIGFDEPERLPREELPDARYDRIPNYERYRNG